jgi:hypothetical protein
LNAITSSFKIKRMYLGVSLFIPSAKISLIRLFNGSIRFGCFCSCRITSFTKASFLVWLWFRIWIEKELIPGVNRL